MQNSPNLPAGGPSQSPSPEKPAGDTRPEVAELHQQIEQRLTEAKTIFEQASRTRVMETIRKSAGESMDVALLKRIEQGLKTIQEANPQDVARAIDAVGALLNAGGSIKGMEKMGQFVDKISKTISALSDQLGVLGSGTLKMLAEMMGENSLLGKFFTMLKDTPTAQLKYLDKKLTEASKTLVTSAPNQPAPKPEEIQNLIRAQVQEGKNVELRHGQNPPKYDFVAHLESTMAYLPSKPAVTKEEFEAAGKKAIEALDKSLPATTNTPVAAEAAKPAERTAKEVTGTEEVKLTSGSADAIKVTKAADGKFSFEANNKKAEIGKIGETDVSKISTRMPTEKEPGEVVLELKDARSVTIPAEKILDLAKTAPAKKSLTAKDNAQNNVTIELAFETPKPTA